MAETTEHLERRLQAATAGGFRNRLLDRGLARGLIWRDGELPPGAPPFSAALTEDLLDYAHTVLAMALLHRYPKGAVDQHFLVLLDEPPRSSQCEFVLVGREKAAPPRILRWLYQLHESRDEWTLGLNLDLKTRCFSFGPPLQHPESLAC